MGNNISIEILGRVVLIEQGHILLAHQIGAENTFLPGGHVEFGESVTAAILREVREEFGGHLEIGDFIGLLEHTFSDLGRDFHTIDIVFAGKLLRPRFPEPVPSREAHLEFFWHPVADMVGVNLLPAPLIPLIQNYAEDQHKGVWISAVSNTGMKVTA